MSYVASLFVCMENKRLDPRFFLDFFFYFWRRHKLVCEVFLNGCLFRNFHKTSYGIIKRDNLRYFWSKFFERRKLVAPLFSPLLSFFQSLSYFNSLPNRLWNRFGFLKKKNVFQLLRKNLFLFLLRLLHVVGCQSTGINEFMGVQRYWTPVLYFLCLLVVGPFQSIFSIDVIKVINSILRTEWLVFDLHRIQTQT